MNLKAAIAITAAITLVIGLFGGAFFIALIAQPGNCLRGTICVYDQEHPFYQTITQTSTAVITQTVDAAAPVASSCQAVPLTNTTALFGCSAFYIGQGNRVTFEAFIPGGAVIYQRTGMLYANGTIIWDK